MSTHARGNARRARARLACLAALAAASCTHDFDRFETGEHPSNPARDAGEVDASAADAAKDAAPFVNDARPPPCDAPGLVARFPFDEGAGTTVHGCTSRALSGFVMGAATWAPGRAGSALELDGSTYVALGNPAVLRLEGALTVTAWVEIAAYPEKVSTYVVGKTGNMAKSGWRLAVEPSRVSFAVARGSDKDGCEATAALTTTGAWVHLAGVFTPGAKVELYVNGALAATTTEDPPAGVLDAPQELRVGVRGDTGAETYFKGRVDDVRLYDRVLAATEIAQLVASF